MTSPQASRVPAVDGLRAVAALSVFFFHLTWRAPLLREGARPLTGHFDTGVEVFFVLSGFLVFGPFAKALLRRASLPSVAVYAAKRVTRVWPAYLVVLLVIAAVGPSDFDGVEGFLSNASLTHLYFDDRGGTGLAVAWTLVVEVSFYLFVPIFALFLLAAPGRRVAAASVALIGVGAFSQWYVAFDLDTVRWTRILPPGLLTLGIGMLLASAVRGTEPQGLIARMVRRAAGHPGAALGVAAMAYLALVIFVPADIDLARSGGQRVAKEYLQAVVALGLALPVLVPRPEGHPWNALLGHRVVAWLGAISYGFYLWHIPVLRWFRPLVISEHVLPAAAGFLGALLVSVALAAVSWHLLEKPLLDLVGRRSARRARPLPAAPAPVPR